MSFLTKSLEGQTEIVQGGGYRFVKDVYESLRKKERIFSQIDDMQVELNSANLVWEPQIFLLPEFQANFTLCWQCSYKIEV